MSTTERGRLLTFESIAEQYPPSKYILLMPQVARHLLTTAPMWSLDVATVKIDPEDEKLAYPITKDKRGLAKQAIDMLAAAADLTVLSRRSDDRSDRLYACYEATAIMQTPSGGVRGQGRTCEWDGEVMREKVRAEAERYIDIGIEKGWRDYKGMTAEARAVAVERRFAEQWLREREFGKRKTESKAGNRAVRSLLGIAPSYSKQELASKEFAIVRFVFTPDMDDRDIKLLVVSTAMQAQRMLYGPPPSTSSQKLLAAAVQQEEHEIVQEGVEQDLAANGYQIVDPDADDTILEETTWEEACENWMHDIVLGLTRVTDIAKFRKLQQRLGKAQEERDAMLLGRLWEYLESQGYLEGGAS